MGLIKLLSALLCLSGWIASSNVLAMECENGKRLDHAFASGASWTFCAVLNEHHALELQELHYQAPGDISRRVLTKLHLGQTLLHYHDQNTADVLIGENKLGGDALKVLNERLCDGELHSVNSAEPQVCSYVLDTGLMAKYNLRPGLQGQQYRLFSVSEYQGLTLQIMIGLSEDGRIAPSVTLSGRLSQTTTDTRFGNALINPITNQSEISTQASVLYNWRMAFAMNDDEPNDTVEEFNFKLLPELGSRRPMQVTALSTETLRKVNNNQFRGWRVKDINGSGYYLDPQNSGYGYSDLRNNWANFDIAITAFDECERHSRVGETNLSHIGGTECYGSLDDFVNGDTLQNNYPVIWYSMSRVLRPKAEDYPVISAMPLGFELIPFDWTQTSPFEVTQ